MIMLAISFILIIILCLTGISSGEGISFKDSPVPVWICWCVLPIAFFGLYQCIKERDKKPKRPDSIIDAEYAKDKEAMDEWYFDEHGEMPEDPEQEKVRKDDK